LSFQLEHMLSDSIQGLGSISISTYHISTLCCDFFREGYQRDQTCGCPYWIHFENNERISAELKVQANVHSGTLGAKHNFDYGRPDRGHGKRKIKFQASKGKCQAFLASLERPAEESLTSLTRRSNDRRI
jgi:hypothetical protein